MKTAFIARIKSDTFQYRYALLRTGSEQSRESVRRSVEAELHSRQFCFSKWIIHDIVQHEHVSNVAIQSHLF